jgi:hypothetical protein
MPMQAWVQAWVQAVLVLVQLRRWELEQQR